MNQKNRNLIIIGSENHDPSTDIVCTWIRNLGFEFIRLNNEDTISVLDIFLDNQQVDILFSYKKRQFYLSNIKSFWYRRGGLKLDNVTLLFGQNYNGNELATKALRNICRKWLENSAGCKYSLA